MGLLILVTSSCVSNKQIELQDNSTSQQLVTKPSNTTTLQATAQPTISTTQQPTIQPSDTPIQQAVTQSNKNLSSQSASTPGLEESKKREIAKKLYADFNSYADKFDEAIKEVTTGTRGDNNPALYSAVMASNRAIGILGVYKGCFTSDEVAKVLKRYKEIRDRMGSFSTVYNGYSKSGLHFIAIRPTSMTSDFAFSSAMNKVRNDDNEMNFVFDIRLLNVKFGVLDVFVEDLTSQRNEINIAVSVAYEDGPNKIDLERIEKPNDISVDQVFTKYQRQYTNNSKLKNGEWKLFFFNKLVGHPIITVYHEGEKIILEK